jgi:DNA-binding transcriptional LysR family regulator
LRVAQPVLTRQIRSLERDLTAQLFERGRIGTRLTDAGRQLLTDAQGLLADAQATCRRVARLGGTIRTFTMGFMPGLWKPALNAFAITFSDRITPTGN